MNKPKIGDKIRLVQNMDFEVGEVFETYDDIKAWWDTSYGEAKMGLTDALELLGEKKASTAEWYAIIENVEQQGEVMAIASFEVEEVIS